MKDLVQVGVFPAELQPRIDAEFRCHPPEAALADEGLRQRVEGIITRSNYTITESLLAALPKLKIVATSGVGYDGIPVAVARAKGVVVTNTPGVLDAAVCELGVGILLALLRRIPEADRFTRERRWTPQSQFPLATSLAGKTVGIVGLGRIGKGIAARLAPFDVRFAYTGSRPRPEVPYRFVAKLHDLAAESDILVITCPGGASTEKLIDAPVLAALGSKGFLVNMSRGSVVDEPALIHALSTGVIAGAGLDVYNDEPAIDPAFFTLPNTVLTPHIGSATAETRAAMLRLTLDNLRAVLGGDSALTPVLV
jgi:lactate dehydrogenase-like 2-hydroxyacid dehydrogenase